MKKKKKLNTRFKIALAITMFAIIIGLVLLVPFGIHLNGQSNVTVEVNGEYIDQGAEPVFGQLQTTSNVDTTKVGEYQVKYQWLFQTRRRKVSVVDTQAPVLTLNQQDTQVCLNSTYNPSGYTVTDNYDTDLTDKVKIIGTVDITKVGDYVEEYTVTDSSNNTTSVKRVVHVVEDDFKYASAITSKVKLDSGILTLIENFYDSYYRAIKYLEPTDFSSFFTASSSNNAYIFNRAVELLVKVRRSVKNDLTLNDCSYALEITSIKISNNNYHIVLYEDSDLQFNFTKGVQSKAYDTYVELDVTKVNNSYLLTNIYKFEGFYLTLFDNYDKSMEFKTAVDKMYQIAYDRMTSQVAYFDTQLSLVNSQQVQPIVKESDHSYDREKAIAYAQEHFNARNPEYMSINKKNCQNFSSQCVYAGIGKMDVKGSISGYQQWKFFTGNNPNKDGNVGYTYTFTACQYFRQYCLRNNASGLVTIVDDNLYFAQPGDLVQTRFDEANRFTHTMVIVDRLENNGTLVDLLVNGNTTDMQNYPLSAIISPYKNLIRIIGYND